MKANLAKVMRESRIAGVTIAVLLFLSIVDVFWALIRPVTEAVEYIAVAIAILGMPYSSGFSNTERIYLFLSMSYLLSAAICFTTAWGIARWLYGAGPIEVLREQGEQFRRLRDA